MRKTEISQTLTNTSVIQSIATKRRKGPFMPLPSLQDLHLTQYLQPRLTQKQFDSIPEDEKVAREEEISRKLATAMPDKITTSGQQPASLYAASRDAKQIQRVRPRLTQEQFKRIPEDKKVAWEEAISRKLATRLPDGTTSSGGQNKST